MLNVVVFTGGRGSEVLSKRLLGRKDVSLTLVVNGYDDGASTGEVRRFLGDSLGPSDFRKNASRVASATGSGSAALVALVDRRLPGDEAAARAGFDTLLADGGRSEGLSEAEAACVQRRLQAFARELTRAFAFADCAVGNVVFAGGFLLAGRAFNAAVDDYAGLLGLPPGVIDNVTRGENAFLVAIDRDGGVLGTEEDIVDARRENRIADIFLIDRQLDAEACAALAKDGDAETRGHFAGRAAPVSLNPRVAAKIDAADLIVYAPGTQYSSLFPSYMTPGVGPHIAGNLRALKLLITNLQMDAEIAGSNAVGLVERALFYLTEKGQSPLPTPFLITHYLLNDPKQGETDTPYVPLGQVDSFEDPRLVRIGFYEDGVTGRHDAAKVLSPFVESLLRQAPRVRVGVLLYGANSANKLTQSMLEIARSQPAQADLTMFAARPPGLADESFVTHLPFAVEFFASEDEAERGVRAAIAEQRLDYVVLFESSGMYRGDDAAALIRYVEGGRLDAVWGSRRLSVRDIDISYSQRRAESPMALALSRAGSHALSLSYLMLYGRYVADTLSGARAIRASDAAAVPVPLTHKLVNQHLLSNLMRRRAELLEVPVQFLPLSHDRVRRTSAGEGLRSLGTILRARLAPRVP
ncbi:MAG: 2-phospho-L-lactate transferase CofD family protein [Acidobacteriota bacterium]|nr:2-phospho-L-lactate transferase CofD family protein [Acidobacteriota bacterium]